MKHWNVYERLWFSLFTIAAIVLAIIQKDSLLGLSAFITGILCVLLAAKGKIMTYVFGMYNTIAYAYISYTNGFYGEMALNLLFFVPMNVLGFLFWKRRLKNDIVEMRRLSINEVGLLMLICAITTVILGWLLALNKDQNTPYIDATTNVLSIAATLLMIWRYREQWMLYIILNIFTIIMWIIRTVQGSSDGIMMIIMWTAFLTNAFYGYYLWTKRTSKQQTAVA